MDQGGPGMVLDSAKRVYLRAFLREVSDSLLLYCTETHLVNIVLMTKMFFVKIFF